jgi:tetratricopeptide (TPR) repeat protein
MPFVLRALGYIHALSGRTAAGLSLLQQALGAIESFRMDVFHALFVTQLGEARLLAGELPEAHALAERALTLAREHGERGCEAGALRLLGDIAVHSDPPDLEKAEGYHHRAIALAEELGMRPIIAHCHLGLGKLYRRTGKREQAQEHLTTATTMYREMDMRFYLEQAEAEVRELT